MALLRNVGLMVLTILLAKIILCMCKIILVLILINA